MKKNSKKKLNVLLIGNTIKEHSFAKKIATSPLLGKLYCISNHSGLSSFGECLDINVENYPKIIKCIKEKKIDFIIPGSSKCLTKDFLRYINNTQAVLLAPSEEVIDVMSSKIALKEMLKSYSIPTPMGHKFTNYEEIINHSQKTGFPLVCKTDDNLIPKHEVCLSEEDLQDFLTATLKEKIAGEEKEHIIVEKYIPGLNFTAIMLVQGMTIMSLPHCYHLYETATSSVSCLDCGFLDKKTKHMLERNILVPLVHALNRQYKDFKGIVSIDIVSGTKGLYVKDWNIYWNDIVATLIANNLKSDLLGMLWSIYSEDMGTTYTSQKWHSLAALGIMFKESNEELFLAKLGRGKSEFLDDIAFYNSYAKSSIALCVNKEKTKDAFAIIEGYCNDIKVPENTVITETMTAVKKVLEK